MCVFVYVCVGVFGMASDFLCFFNFFFTMSDWNSSATQVYF